MRAPRIDIPTLTTESDSCLNGPRYVSVNNLELDLIACLGEHSQRECLLRSMLRVKVVGGDSLPDVFGRYKVLENEIRFIPHFPFEPGVRFRAFFDPRPLGCPEFSKALTLEFSLPKRIFGSPALVTDVYPSEDALPENLLRMYVCFSNPMRRGRAEKNITLLDSEGRLAPDTLYRAPVELWDRSMRHLSVLLDPGRLKRGVGPNRELGPPLKAGRKYTLAIGSGMVDASGSPLSDTFYKSFDVTAPVREPVSIEKWKLLCPATNSQEPLVLVFPTPLDWALLRRAITIASEGRQSVGGRVAIAQQERRWSFTPTVPWTAESYQIRVASGLEDVCGNTLRGAFDQPLQSAGDLSKETAGRSILFHLV